MGMGIARLVYWEWKWEWEWLDRMGGNKNPKLSHLPLTGIADHQTLLIDPSFA